MVNPGPYVEFYLKSEENPPEGFEQEEPWCCKVELVRLGSLAVTMLVHVGMMGVCSSMATVVKEQRGNTHNITCQCLVIFLVGEGHGNPLWSSCLENPVVRGAWWAAVHGVAWSQT